MAPLSALTQKGSRLDTKIESGTFNDKHTQEPVTSQLSQSRVQDDGEDEDMDALIEELESDDGNNDEVADEAEVSAGTERFIPEDQLQTDPRVGLTESEVQFRRKKYGLNQMKEEKENSILKFLGFFIGPIQFVMEVS